MSLCGIATPCLPASLPRSNGKARPPSQRQQPCLTDLEREKVVQHILNLSGIAEALSTLSDSLIEQIDDLAQALDIETEFAPFDDDFPDPSITK